MSDTPIYGSPELTTNPTNADATVNNMVRVAERAGNSTKEWTVAADFTATKAQMAEGIMHELNGSPAAPFAFGVYPVARLFLVQNNTGRTCTVYVQGSSGAGVDVLTGQTVLLLSDGVNVSKMTLS